MFDLLKISNAQTSSFIFCKGPTFLDIKNHLQGMQILKQQQTKGTMKPSHPSPCWTLVNMSHTDDSKWQVTPAGSRTGDTWAFSPQAFSSSASEYLPHQTPSPWYHEESPTLFTTSHYSPNWRVWAEWNLTRILVTLHHPRKPTAAVAACPPLPRSAARKGWLWSGRIWQLWPPSSLLASVWVWL